MELSSCLENINLYYKSLFLRRFLEIRLSVFFGKKSEIFKTLRKNFETILEVGRGRRPSEKEREKKSRSTKKKVRYNTVAEISSNAGLGSGMGMHVSGAKTVT